MCSFYREGKGICYIYRLNLSSSFKTWGYGVSDLCCYSVNQVGMAGSHPCCVLQEKLDKCREGMAWHQSLQQSRHQADHHSNDQQDTDEQLGLLQANITKSCLGGKQVSDTWYIHEQFLCYKKRSASPILFHQIKKFKYLD